MPKYPYKRQLRNYLIDPQMQREYTLLTVVLIMIACLVIAFLVQHTIHDTMQNTPFRLGKVSPYELMSEINYQLIVRISLALLATITVSAVVSVVFLHRIAGPMYRFRIILQEILSGKIPPHFQIRQKDFYKDVADDLNGVIDVLTERHKTAKEARAILKKVASEKLPARLQDEVQETLKALESNLASEEQKS